VLYLDIAPTTTIGVARGSPY